MKQTFLLTKSLTHPFTSRWILLILALINLTSGIRNLLQAPVGNYDILLSILLIVSGIVLIIMVFTIYNPTSSISPKLIIDEKGITVKEQVSGEINTIAWNDIRQITYGSGELKFLLTDNRNETVGLVANADTIVSIKNVIRGIADEHSIEIIGG